MHMDDSVRGGGGEEAKDNQPLLLLLLPLLVANLFPTAGIFQIPNTHFHTHPRLCVTVLGMRNRRILLARQHSPNLWTTAALNICAAAVLRRGHGGVHVTRK